jgi:hypothetical protein
MLSAQDVFAFDAHTRGSRPSQTAAKDGAPTGLLPRGDQKSGRTPLSLTPRSG